MLLVQQQLQMLIIQFLQCFNTLYVVGSKMSKSTGATNYASFNTLYVVGSNGDLVFQKAITKFQYIICCWFNKILNDLGVDIACFNTLYVVGSKLMCMSKLHLKVRFNTLYVVGSTKRNWQYLQRYYVSIHYMLLVQVSDSSEIFSENKFQYIICCWFNNY